jgi:hypothetical protein
MTVRQVVTVPRLRSAALPTACWVWTRAVLVMFTYKIIPYISQGDIVGDVKLYNQWSQTFAHGRFPHDPQWQYPPGAAFVIELPKALHAVTGISYYSGFYLLALLSDLIIFLLVLYASWRTADRRATAGLAAGAGPANKAETPVSSVTAGDTNANRAEVSGTGLGDVGVSGTRAINAGSGGKGAISARVGGIAANGVGANGTGTGSVGTNGAADGGTAAIGTGIDSVAKGLRAGRTRANGEGAGTGANGVGADGAGLMGAGAIGAAGPSGVGVEGGGEGAGPLPAAAPLAGSGVAAISVRPDYTGLWAYTVAIFMIGPIVLGRYDIMVTMVATVALVAMGRSAAATWRVRGAAIGLGAALKLWPAAIAVGLPKRANGRRALLWALLAAVVPALGLAAFLPGSLSFLTGQHDRGLEIESVPATLFLIARHFGYPAKIRHQYGAFEVTGPGISQVSTFSVLLTVAGFVWLLAVWRRRADLVPGRWTTALYYDAGLVAVLIAIITSRVLSPQYLVWLVGLIALCLTLAPHGSDGVVLESGAVSSAGAVLEPGTVVGSGALLGPDTTPAAGADGEGRSVLAMPCWILLAAISVTQIDFPLLFPRLIHDGRFAAWFLAGRNLLLVTAALGGMRALWRAVAPAPRPATRGEQTSVNAEPCSRVAQPEEQPAGQ